MFASKCANRKERSKGKALNISWDDDSEEEDSEVESPIHASESAKFVAFMTRTNSSLVQGYDKDPKPYEDLNLPEFSDDDQDLEEVYMKLLKDFMRLSRINDKLSHKLKISVSKLFPGIRT